MNSNTNLITKNKNNSTELIRDQIKKVGIKQEDEECLMLIFERIFAQSREKWVDLFCFEAGQIILKQQLQILSAYCKSLDSELKASQTKNHENEVQVPMQSEIQVKQKNKGIKNKDNEDEQSFKFDSDSYSYESSYDDVDDDFRKQQIDGKQSP